MTAILILSAGRRVSLVRGFQAAAADRGMRVIAADLNPGMSSACRIVEAAFRLPHVLSDDYPPALIRLCEVEGVSLVVPTLDTELAVLAAIRDEMALRGVHIVVSDATLIAACRDKRRTANYFAPFGLRSPEIFDRAAIRYPAIVKPFDGSLSKGIHILQGPDEWHDGYADEPRNIFCEYLDHGRYSEFTCDGYFARGGDLCCIVPRQRLEVRGGEVAKGRTVRGAVYDALIRSLQHVPGARGCLTIQVMYDAETDDLRLIEVNPRFGGGYPLTARCGGTYHEWLVREYLEGSEIPFFDRWQDRLTMLRYDAEIFVDDQ